MRYGWMATGLLASALVMPAQAQEPVSLRVADVYPEGHYIAEALVKVFMAKVEEELGDRVALEYFPASQLGKGPDMLTLTQSGVVDIGIIVPPFLPDKLPLSAVAELPGSFTEACDGTAAFWALSREGVLKEAEYDPNGIHVLLATVLPPYQIFLRDEIAGVASFEGQKIYSTGGAKDLTVRKLGGVPIRMATQELYEALSRGTIDGGLMGYGTAIAYRTPGFVNYATRNENFGSGVITYAISNERWAELPEDVREALDRIGEEATMAACQTISAGVEADIAALGEAGVTLVDLPEADRETVDAALASVAEEWAAELDGRGHKGSDTLSAFREALDRSN